MTPGIHYDVPFDEYLKWPYMSKSRLVDFALCPAQLWARISGELPSGGSDAYLLGSATDDLWTRGHGSLRAAGYAIMPDNMRRYGRAWDEWRDTNNGLKPIPGKMARKASAMASALNRNERARAIRDASRAQVAVVWDHQPTGIRMKGLIDLLDLGAGIMADLKTTKDARPWQFARACSDYQYHWQMALYLDGLAAHGHGDLKSWIIAVRKEPVHSVGCYALSAEAIELARHETTLLLQQFKRQLALNEWPADIDDQTLDLPGYRYKEAT